MTLVPGTVYDPDILLGSRFIPNISWPEPLSSFRPRPDMCGLNCILFCSYIELPRLRTMAIGQQEDLKRGNSYEIERVKKWLTETHAHEVSVEYTYWFYSSFNSTFKSVSIDFPRFKFKDHIPETFQPLARVFFRRYRPFKIDMSTMEIARRMGFKMEELWNR